MNHRTILKSLAVLLSLSGVALAGCYKEVGVTRNWGKSNNSNFAKMVADPEAPASLDVPMGLDAGSVEGMMTKHRKGETSDRQPQQMAPSIIEIGGGK
jgi:hypothetical protein